MNKINISWKIVVLIIAGMIIVRSLVLSVMRIERGIPSEPPFTLLQFETKK